VQASGQLAMAVLETDRVFAILCKRYGCSVSDLIWVENQLFSNPVGTFIVSPLFVKMARADYG
jgi:hypothetical protein